MTYIMKDGTPLAVVSGEVIFCFYTEVQSLNL